MRFLNENRIIFMLGFLVKRATVDHVLTVNTVPRGFLSFEKRMFEIFLFNLFKLWKV